MMKYEIFKDVVEMRYLTICHRSFRIQNFICSA